MAEQREYSVGQHGNPYKDWQKEEGIPAITGYYIKDMNEVEVKPWARKGGKGSFVNLIGAEEANDCYVCEIAPGQSLKPQRHLFEEVIYIVKGRGATTIWNEGGKKQTFEWQEGSIFSPPLNAWHQHFNGSGDNPARYLAVTSAPVQMSLFHSKEFIFNNKFVFKDRFSGEEGYFSGKGKSVGVRIWESNFIPDVRVFKLQEYKERGAGGTNIRFHLSENALNGHVSEFPVGTYKKGHRHGPGAHVIIVGGKGYSLMWPEGAEKIKIDWQENSMFVPPDRWFHQHFNSGTTPARYLALHWVSHKYAISSREYKGIEDVEQGGDQIEYTNQDPSIHELFTKELARVGLTPRMDAFYKKK